MDVAEAGRPGQAGPRQGEPLLWPSGWHTVSGWAAETGRGAHPDSPALLDLGCHAE